jgi:hypothetical protein
MMVVVTFVEVEEDVVAAIEAPRRMDDDQSMEKHGISVSDYIARKKRRKERQLKAPD